MPAQLPFAACLLAFVLAARAREPVDPGWLGTVQADLAAREYHVSVREADGALVAPNRAQDLRAAWIDGALHLTPRTGTHAWSFRYELLSIGRARERAPAVAATDATGERVELHRDRGVVEWYVNGPRGLEQGFTLDERPAGDGLLVVEGRIDGLLAYPDAIGQGVTLRTPRGVEALRVGDLHVTDASGSVLPACFDVASGTLGLVVDDTDATYPITIDPLFTAPAFTLDGSQPGELLGVSVAAAGDVDGDGHADVIVGASRWDDGANVDEGRAQVHHGSASGLQVTPAWVVQGNQPNAYLGAFVSTAGDADGDSFADVLVGATGWDNGEVNEGRASLYLGSASGLSTTSTWSVEANQDRASLGRVAPAGDVDGDGFDDVLVGAPLFDNGGVDEGIVMLFVGGNGGPASTPDWIAEGQQDGAQLGIAFSGAGDVDGDGFADVVVGAWMASRGQANEGVAQLYLGSAGGLLATPDWTAEADQAGAHLGFSVGAAGDVDGDGYADVAVGAPDFDALPLLDAGQARVYRGGPAGPAPSAAWTVTGTQAAEALGQVVTSAGDVDDDGFADVLVASPFFDGALTDEGLVRLYRGGAAGLSTTGSWSVTSGEQDARIPVVAPAGDVDGDGFSDVLVATQFSDAGGMDAGRVRLYRGSGSATPLFDGAWQPTDDQVDSELGFVLAAAGDVDGDGTSDLVVAAPAYDGAWLDSGAVWAYHGSASGLSSTPAWVAYGTEPSGRFGHAVAGGGDVNGDGYSDVVVGAPFEAALGHVFAFHGSPSGLGTTPEWTGTGAMGSRFGASIALAGDGNGDGFADLLVGAPDDESLRGSVSLFAGSRTGLAAARSWRVVGADGMTHLGDVVAWAGDVDADGYTDALARERNVMDVTGMSYGRVHAFHGSRRGPSPVADWTLSASDLDTELGAALSAAGDVNADGFADVAIGEPGFSGGEASEGRVLVFAGSAAGLPATPTWAFEPDADGARLGSDVVSAGDVNADGHGDLAVAAPGWSGGFELLGRVVLFLGSGSGLGAAPAWIWDGSPITTQGFAESLAGALDVNGDGASDLVIGGDPPEVHLGNESLGLARLARQARADGTAPIDLLGGAPRADGFRVRADARMPFGRGRVRIESEVKPLGQPFDGSGMQLTAWRDTGAPGATGSVVGLENAAGSLPTRGPYRWRLRIRSRSVVPWVSHWMSMPGNAITETDVRVRQADLLRNADVTRRWLDQHPTILRAGAESTLDPVRDLHQADVLGLALVTVPGDAAFVGEGNAGVLVFYEVIDAAGTLRASRSGADVVLRGW